MKAGAAPPQSPCTTSPHSGRRGSLNEGGGGTPAIAEGPPDVPVVRHRSMKAGAAPPQSPFPKSLAAQITQRSMKAGAAPPQSRVDDEHHGPRRLERSMKAGAAPPQSQEHQDSTEVGYPAQ